MEPNALASASWSTLVLINVAFNDKLNIPSLFGGTSASAKRTGCLMGEKTCGSCRWIIIHHWLRISPFVRTHWNAFNTNFQMETFKAIASTLALSLSLWAGSEVALWWHKEKASILKIPGRRDSFASTFLRLPWPLLENLEKFSSKGSPFFCISKSQFWVFKCLNVFHSKALSRQVSVKKKVLD